MADNVLGGVCHDLVGRVSSLDGLIQLLQLDGAEKTPVVPYLEEEVGRLQEVVRVLRLIPGDLDADPEPMLVEELARRATDLHRKHRGLETLETRLDVEPGLQPVLVNPARASRSLLILLALAGRAALERESRSVQVVASGTADEVVLRMVPWASALPADGANPVLNAIGYVLAADLATVRSSGEGLEVVFPSLARARARAETPGA